jgi:hypothetical protein
MWLAGLGILQTLRADLIDEHTQQTAKVLLCSHCSLTIIDLSNVIKIMLCTAQIKGGI